MTNPILIEVTRGPLVESVHRGAIAVAGVDGSLHMAIGDVDRDVFPRSSIKALQCLPLIETGAADHFKFGDEEIALACASHTGTPRHTGIAQRMLERIGLGEEALGCGVHPPLGSKASKDLWRTGGQPCQLHNNCSGKHAGMLATACHVGEPVTAYWTPDHPVQVRIHEALKELSGLELGDDVRGLDGCSLPNWAMPLKTLAMVFARLVTGEGQEPERRAAFGRIMKACWAEPELVAGRGRSDTIVMSSAPSEVFMKTGAEGVYAGGFPKLGIGFALKVDDGATRASAGAVMALVERIIPKLHGAHERRLLKSFRGLEVGEIHSSTLFKQALDALQVR